MLLLLSAVTIVLALVALQGGVLRRQLASQARQLSHAEQRFRSIFEGVGVAMLVQELDGRILIANRAAIDLFGVPLATLGTLGLDSLFAGDAGTRAAAALSRAVRHSEAEFEAPIGGSATGALRVSLRIARVEFDGEPRLVTVAQDVTDRSLARLELEQSVSLLRATLEATADGILVVDRAGRIISFNQKFVEMWRMPGSTMVVGADRAVLVHMLRRLRDRHRCLQLLREIGVRPEAASDHVIDLDDGRIFEIWSQPQRLGSETVGRVWSFRDITDRRHAEEELRRNEERFRALIENIADSIVVVDARGVIRYASSTQRTTGHEPHTLIGLECFDLVHPDEADLARRALAEIVERRSDSVVLELRARHRDGSWHTLEVTARNLLDHPAVSGVVINSHDITERKRVEEALQVQKTYFAELFENAPEAIVLLDEHDRVLRANHEFLRMFGYTVDEALGRTAGELVAPDELAEESRAITGRVTAGEKVSLETVRRRKDGTLLDVSILCTPIQETGESARVYGIYRDITERKQLEDRLRQSQRMEAVGRLAGGIAHDFNNLLTAIKGHTRILLDDAALDATLDATVRQDLAEVDRAADRAADLTRQLLAFSRKQILRPRVLDLNGLIVEMERMLRRLIGEDISLSTALASTLGRVRADPGQLEQVLLNLVVNARDAMPTGGRLHLETRNVELANADLPRMTFLRPGAYVLLSVSDTGTGMDPQTQARIFEPFYTTKEQGKGTGLGLSTVYGIVKQSDGYIWVESEVGRGSTFRIYLPRVDGESEERRTTEPPFAAGGTGETVLLVEDEDAVRSLAKRILERRGYAVLAARTGAEALSLYEHHDGPIDLLLTDVVMPEMGGRELAERLSSRRPDLRVLFMSGYTEDDVIRRGVLGAGAAFLEKPFSPDSLAAKVREAIDRRSD